MTNILATILSFLIATPVFGAFLGNVPQKTLAIAKKASYGSEIQVEDTIVRVGIGNQNFSNYEWKDAVIYGTGEFEVYNNQTYINTFDRENTIKITTVDKIFVLTDSKNNVIAKVSGPIIFKSDFGLFGIKNLKRGGKDALYRGCIELVTAKNGGFHIVNTLGVEDYLKGVVPNEMPVTFGLEALKAQSVAARNYVLSPRVKANPNYDVVDSVASQVYYGANTEKDLSNKAIKETQGIVALYDWNLILAQYSSTAGGYTESYHNAFSDNVTKKFPSDIKPYLMARPDYPETPLLNSEEAAYKFYTSKPASFDVNSSYYRWQKEWTQVELQKEIQDHIAAQSATGFVKPAVNRGTVIGKITDIKVLERGNSGKIIALVIKTANNNSYRVEKELVIRRLFTNQGKALPSANVVFDITYDKNGNLQSVRAFGGGYGHGVGMSQFGAGFMATNLKKKYDEILKHYYSGISLGTVPFILSSHPEQNIVVQTFYTKDKKANLILDNKYKVKTLDININGEEFTFPLETTQRYQKIKLDNFLKPGQNILRFTYVKKDGALRGYIEMAGNDD